MVETLDRGEPLPVDLRDQIVYYVGPSPAKPGQAIGSAGPTTSGRMDAYAPRLMEKGLSGMIGKGNRSQAVKDAMQRYGTVYFAATGGAGALLSRCIRSYTVLAYAELGPDIEALGRGRRNFLQKVSPPPPPILPAFPPSPVLAPRKESGYTVKTCH